MNYLALKKNIYLIAKEKYVQKVHTITYLIARIPKTIYILQ